MPEHTFSTTNHRPRWQQGALALLALTLAACVSLAPPKAPDHPAGAAVAIPELALPAVAPADLGAEVQLNQHLSIRRGNDGHEIDVALAVDSTQVRLAALGMGLRLITVTWTGQGVSEQRHPLLPAEVSGERILRDLVLTWWPAERLRAALPTGWALQDSATERRVLWQGQPVLHIRYDAGAGPRWLGNARLEHLLHGYSITIVSAAA